MFGGSDAYHSFKEIGARGQALDLVVWSQTVEELEPWNITYLWTDRFYNNICPFQHPWNIIGTLLSSRFQPLQLNT